MFKVFRQGKKYNYLITYIGKVLPTRLKFLSKVILSGLK